MATVFISHANQDAEFAYRLAGDLRRLGVPVWIAPDSIRPGEGWVRAIERGLAESSHVVVVLTSAALASKWVEKETEVAIARERKGRIQVIPLDVEPCEVPPFLSSYQWVSFRRDYDAGLSQLADILGVRVPRPEPEMGDYDINQLLHREPVEIDQTEVAAYLAGAMVLVTGAGGSIGSELCRQIARFNPAKEILLGHGENSIYRIGLDLHLSFPDLILDQVIADVRDQQRVNWVIEKYRPDVIFHAAAHKHIPFMESSVEEAITNNVLGTRNVLRAAEQYGVERFVLISTDKAVNPTSVMGATKRLAELLVVTTARRSGRAHVAVRFGNVLGSRGNVVSVFQRQIAAGGPLTITHPDMRRYLMTIPEAVQLVLQASEMGRGGEIFVLDMGKPVRILDLAMDLIKLSGLEPGRDIKIVYTGIRPGEKLTEELFLEGEDCRRTKHSRILVTAYESPVGAEMLEQVVIELVNLARQMQSRDATEQMRVLLSQVCYYIDKNEPRLVLDVVAETIRSTS